MLAGEPNAGKSTLANAIVGRAVSIVDPAAGTTRDWVAHIALLDGVPIQLIDTAGLWEPPGATLAGASAVTASADVDAQAAGRARIMCRQADLVVWLSHQPAPEWMAGLNVLNVLPKADLLERPDGKLAVSGLTGQGMPQLSQAIRNGLGVGEINPADASAFTERQKDLLAYAAQALRDGSPETARIALEDLLRGEV